MSVSNISKKQLFEEIINIVFENKEILKEGDYITLNEKLMKLYNEVDRDDEPEGEGRYIRFEPNQFVKDALEHIMHEVYVSKEQSYEACDINLSLAMDIDFEPELYELLKTTIIPRLVTIGFDCTLYYNTDNDFTADNFDDYFSVRWARDLSRPSAYMENKIERFNKITPFYYFDTVMESNGE